MSDQLFLEGEWRNGGGTAPVLNKFTGEVLAHVAQASAQQVSAAVAALHEAHLRNPLPPARRAAVLRTASELVARHREKFVDLMAAESGFTLADLEREVDRAVQTLQLCAEESTRLTGEMVPLEGAEGVTGRIGFTIRYPIGVVAAITPFNSPLNTVVHKIGPAIAAGNAVVLKPSMHTPLTAAKLVALLLEAGLPPGLIALLQGDGASVGHQLVADQRIAFYTFTGSTAVGRQIQAGVGVRRTQLELGGLSSTIVCGDADIARAAKACVAAAFRKAGQVCTSVQRIYVDAEVADEFTDALLGETALFPAGDPRDPRSMLGPMISLDNAERVEAWVDEALGAGARLLAGGDRDGAVVAPTVLQGVPPSAKVMCEEVFGPVVSLCPFAELDDALDAADDTPYGLAAGVFTDDLSVAFRAAERLRVGTVHINQTSSSRIDLMPYGGVKESGFGQEGPKYAAREMTEERLITITHR